MPPRIALAGATGNLGQPILAALLEAGHPVTVLSRKGGNTSKLHPHPNLTIKEVDLTSASSITTALQENDQDKVEVLVSCLATHAIGSQNPLIDAAVNAGVKRFIPAEFGMDSMNPRARELPVCEPKAATQAYLNEKCEQNSGFTWTAIANGLFLDWCLEMGIILDLKARKATLYNGGDVVFSATLLKDIAKAVLGVIAHQDETKNRVVYVHSAAVSQRMLMGFVDEVAGDGKEWDVVVKATEEVKREGLAEVEKGDEGDAGAAELGFSIVGSMDPECGCDFSGRLDNEVLGVKVLTVDELREVIKGLL